MISVDPEQWMDEHRELFSQETVETFERIRMFLRGWALFKDIHEPLAQEMIEHFCIQEDILEFPMLHELLTQCAHYHILMVCGDLEAILKVNDQHTPHKALDEQTIRRNQFMDSLLGNKRYEDAKMHTEETIDIFQKYLLDKKSQLMDIESRWWKLVRFAFQYRALNWVCDADKIYDGLFYGKNPDALIPDTHQDEFTAITNFIDLIAEIQSRLED